MKRFIFIIAMTLVAAAAAYAQRPPTAGDNTRQAALSDPDPVRRDERLISINRSETSKMERNRPPYGMSGLTFKAQIVVANRNSRTIKSVSWVATLTDPNTGEVIGKYDITSETRISPGKQKKLEKKLPIPQFRVVDVAAPRTVANLKSVVTSVTFADGTTSNEP